MFDKNNELIKKNSKLESEICKMKEIYNDDCNLVSKIKKMVN